VTREWEQAARRGSIEALDRLLQNGADVNARDGHGQTALMIAAAEGHDVAVAWLAERGARLNHTAKYGLSALMLAVVRGRVDVVRTLVWCGADASLRGSGAPGFADKTALDLAVARNDAEMVRLLAASAEPGHRRALNPHFEMTASWLAARTRLTFQPLEPKNTAGRRLQWIRIHVRDHTLRELRIDERTLEAHYGDFVLTQSRKSVDEARRLALDVSYGREVREALVAGRAARVYERGPEPAPDDIDGRSPSVVVWHDAEMFYLIASGEMTADALLPVAESLY
jgi:ankyrin repeat protein